MAFASEPSSTKAFLIEVSNYYKVVEEGIFITRFLLLGPVNRRYVEEALTLSFLYWCDRPKDFLVGHGVGGNGLSLLVLIFPRIPQVIPTQL